MITEATRQEIEKAIGRRITAMAPLSAANNAQIYRLDCGGRFFVAKVGEKGLDAEAWMIDYLKKHSKLPVPNVHYSNAHVILMDFVEAHHSLDALCQKDAAAQLAALHGVTAEFYGLERDTLIGALPQPNAQESDWHKFFAEHRLLYMGGKALDEGKIDKKTMSMVEKLAKKLPDLLDKPPAPALIHGDIWSGNILAGRGRVAAFVDPAIYYADSEIELAFIRLFNVLLALPQLAPAAPRLRGAGGRL